MPIRRARLKSGYAANRDRWQNGQETSDFDVAGHERLFGACVQSSRR